LLVLAALAVAAAPAEAAPAWLGPDVVSGSEEPATSPVVAMNAEGDAVSSWVHYAGGTGYEAVVSTRPAGGRWSTPVRYACGNSPCEQRVAIGPAGEAFLAYRHYLGAEGSLIEAARGSLAGAWVPATGLSEKEGFASEPVLAVDATGGATVAWRQYDAPSYRVRESTRPAGGTWGPARYVTPPGEETATARIAVDATGNVLAVWTGEEAAAFVVRSSTRSATGSWSQAVDLSDGVQNALEPEPAVSPSGHAVVTWLRQNKKSGYYFAQVISSAPGGGWAKPAVDLGNGGETGSANPTVAIDEAGDAAALWMEVEGGQYVIRASGQTAGGAWEPGTRLTVSGEAGFEPSIALDSHGDATALWITQSGTRYLVRSARRPAGAGWTAPETVSGEGFEADDARLAIDADGDALAVWQGKIAATTTTEAAEFDGAGPQLRSPAIPATGAVGAALDFSVTPVDVFSTVGAIQWDFGDGATASAARATHAYSHPGTYAVSVEATDSLGNVSRATGTVTIPAPAAPVAPGGQGAPPKGSAHAGRVVRVKGGKALVALTCGQAACAGVVKLTVPAPRSRGRAPRKARPALLLGKASFKIAAGKEKTVPVPLGKKALARLGRHGARLAARLEGSGLSPRPVVLAFPTKHHAGKGKR
jgi:hypothetical protein